MRDSRWSSGNFFAGIIFGVLTLLAVASVCVYYEDDPSAEVQIRKIMDQMSIDPPGACRVLPVRENGILSKTKTGYSLRICKHAEDK